MLSFSPPGHEPFKLAGQVTWINKVRANGDNRTPDGRPLRQPTPSARFTPSQVQIARMTLDDALAIVGREVDESGRPSRGSGLSPFARTC